MARKTLKDFNYDYQAYADYLESAECADDDDYDVYADIHGNKGHVPARKVQVIDTTGAGDAFCSGVVAALTYGKNLSEAAEIGSYLAASVITSSDNVCPRFRPSELGLDVEVED